MRIAVAQRFLVQKATALGKDRNDVLVGVEHALAREERRAFDKAPIAADRIVDRELVPLTDVVVFLAMARGRVNCAGACIERDMLAENHRHDALVERMIELHAFEPGACDFGDAPESLAPARVSTALARSLASTSHSAPVSISA